VPVCTRHAPRFKIIASREGIRFPRRIRHAVNNHSDEAMRQNTAIGAPSIRRLAIRRVLIESAEFKSLEIQDLSVTRLRAAEITVSDSVKLPRSNVDRKIS
jgi:hypothetical protein